MHFITNSEELPRFVIVLVDGRTVLRTAVSDDMIDAAASAVRAAKRPPLVKKVGPITMRFDAKNERAARWADKHAAELIDGIAETTREDIANAVAEAQESGNLREMYEEILAAVGDTTRAQLIARTESMMAANAGQREGWAQAVDEGLLPEDAIRSWIATSDACPLCEALNEQTTSLDGEYPDPGGEGPILHPNCRCTEGIVG